MRPHTRMKGLVVDLIREWHVELIDHVEVTEPCRHHSDHDATQPREAAPDLLRSCALGQGVLAGGCRPSHPDFPQKILPNDSDEATRMSPVTELSSIR